MPAPPFIFRFHSTATTRHFFSEKENQRKNKIIPLDDWRLIFEMLEISRGYEKMDYLSEIIRNELFQVQPSEFSLVQPSSVSKIRENKNKNKRKEIRLYSHGA